MEGLRQKTSEASLMDAMLRTSKSLDIYIVIFIQLDLPRVSRGGRETHVNSYFISPRGRRPPCRAGCMVE